ncbi:MAG: hypothetical protein P1V81_17425 [Planctomycetota bacterium]|nr:hypothetical protein [Planctomycetota bacterium]
MSSPSQEPTPQVPYDASNPDREAAWSLYLTEATGNAVRVSFGRARRQVIQSKGFWNDPRGRPIEVRLAGFFREAPEEVLGALATWLKQGRRAKRASRLLDEFIEASLAAAPPRQRKRPSADARGQTHDLAELTQQLFDPGPTMGQPPAAAGGAADGAADGAAAAADGAAGADGAAPAGAGAAVGAAGALLPQRPPADPGRAGAPLLAAADLEPLGMPLITWGRKGPSRARRSLQLGSYEEDRHLIRIHRVLDQPAVPESFVRFVLFHELLHATRAAESQRNPDPERAGRRLHHDAEFRRAEARFPGFDKAQKWQQKHIAALLRSARSERPLKASRPKQLLDAALRQLRLEF